MENWCQTLAAWTSRGRVSVKAGNRFWGSSPSIWDSRFEFLRTYSELLILSLWHISRQCWQRLRSKLGYCEPRSILVFFKEKAHTLFKPSGLKGVRRLSCSCIPQTPCMFRGCHPLQVRSAFSRRPPQIPELGPERDDTANPRTTNLDFRGFDSRNILSMLRDGIPRSAGSFPYI